MSNLKYESLANSAGLKSLEKRVVCGVWPPSWWCRTKVMERKSEKEKPRIGRPMQGCIGARMLPGLLVPVVTGLVGAFRLDADVVGLILRKRGELGSNFLKVEARNLFV